MIDSYDDITIMELMRYKINSRVDRFKRWVKHDVLKHPKPEPTELEILLREASPRLLNQMLNSLYTERINRLVSKHKPSTRLPDDNEVEKMKYKIHCTIQGQEDIFIIEGETMKEIRDKAFAELEKRGGTDAWSGEME